MSRKAQLDRLLQIVDLAFDNRMSVLRSAARARQHSEAQLVGLSAPPERPEGLTGMAADLAAIAYQQWADQRRQDLNMLLAQQTASWLDAREDARLAFGQREALRAIRQRLVEEQRRKTKG